jgi:hypothetical protein
MVFKVLTNLIITLKIGLHSNNHLTLVNISVVHVNGLGLTLSVNVIIKFIYTSCRCKNKYVHMILCGCEKEYKCKIKHIYMILYSWVK